MIGNFPAVLNFNWLFLKLNRFICNQLPVLPDHSLPCSCRLLIVLECGADYRVAMWSWTHVKASK